MHFSVNSEANARRIAFVEQCFGSSGQVKHAVDDLLSHQSAFYLFVCLFHITPFAATHTENAVDTRVMQNAQTHEKCVKHIKNMSYNNDMLKIHFIQ